MALPLEPATSVLPDRGGTIITLGILSLPAALFGVPLGVVPWIMGSRDLKAMNAGQLDSEGWRTTQAGRTLGIVSTVLALLALLMGALAVMLFGMRGDTGRLRATAVESGR